MSAMDFLRRRPTGEMIAIVVDAVVQHYGLVPDLVYSRDQRAPVVWARHVALVLTREYTFERATALAEHFRLDRTMVRHAQQRFDDAVETQPRVAAEIASIRAAIELAAPEVKGMSLSLTQRRQLWVDGQQPSRDEAEAELEIFMRDLRKSLVAAIRLDPGAVLVGIKRAADQVNKEHRK